MDGTFQCVHVISFPHTLQWLNTLSIKTSNLIKRESVCNLNLTLTSTFYRYYVFQTKPANLVGPQVRENARLKPQSGRRPKKHPSLFGRTGFWLLACMFNSWLTAPTIKIQPSNSLRHSETAALQRPALTPTDINFHICSSCKLKSTSLLETLELLFLFLCINFWMSKDWFFFSEQMERLKRSERIVINNLLNGALSHKMCIKWR